MKLLFVLVLASGLAKPGYGEGRHAFSVKDSIEMTRFSDPSASDPNARAKFSPDGRYFFVVTSRGILSSNSVESTLWLYHTDQIFNFAANPKHRKPPGPTKLTTVVAVPEVIATAPYESMITGVKWSPDSHTIYFLAQNRAGNRQLSSVDIRSREVERMTRPGSDVYQYAVARKTIIFSALLTESASHRSHEAFENPSYAISGTPLDDLILSDSKFSMLMRQIWVLHLDTGRTVHLTQFDERQHFTADSADDALSISSDGHFAALLASVREVPESWAKYQPASGQEHLRIDPQDTRRTSASNLNFNRLKKFSIVDLRNGRSQSVNAPIARQLGYFSQTKAVWSQDGKTVLLTNTFLPFGQNAFTTHEKNHPCVAAILRLHSMHVSCVAWYGSDPAFSDVLGASQVRDASFGQDDNSVSLLIGPLQGGQQIREYRLSNQSWTLVRMTKIADKTAITFDAISALSKSLPRVSIQQTLNDPPVLSVTVESHSLPLWDPNPQLKEMSRGEATVLHWTDRHGTEWTGGLVKPVNYIAGKRYPLVIQMYQFRDGEFMTDGMATTAMAAQPLATAGIIFLQISKQSHSFNQTEFENHLEGMLSAIDLLNAAGLVDPRKVGLIGFSASCPYVEYALIKAPQRFAAATIADGIDYSYMQAMLWGSTNIGLREQFQRVNGGPPFGPSLKHWFHTALNFQVANVETPLRIEAIRPASLLSEWELYSSLSQQDKPVDLIYIPDGQHILQKPKDRMISQQGNVDWFSYWLRGRKTPSPLDPNEYQRWGELSKLVQVQKDQTSDAHRQGRLP